MEKKLILILNPCAGTRQATKYLADIIALFSSCGYVCTVYITDRRGAAIDFVIDHAVGADMIVCIGGDGTLSEVINGVVKSGFRGKLGYIPAGSTNDFANSLRISSNIMTAARDIVEGVEQTLDVGSFNDRYFAYVASFGAFTRVSYSTPQDLKNALGHLAYILEGAKDITSIRSEHLRFEVGDDVYENDYVFGAVSNSTSLAGLLTINPDVVDLNDGLFEILLIKAPRNLDELLRITTALTKQQYDIDLIDFVSTDRVTVTSAGNVDWSLDGEHAVSDKTVTIRNLRDAITIMLRG